MMERLGINLEDFIGPLVTNDDIEFGRKKYNENQQDRGVHEENGELMKMRMIKKMIMTMMDGDSHEKNCK